MLVIIQSGKEAIASTARMDVHGKDGDRTVENGSYPVCISLI